MLDSIRKSAYLDIYTESQKKCTMKSLASPGTQSQGQVTPAGSYFIMRIWNKVYLSTLLHKRNATFHRAFLLRLSVDRKLNTFFNFNENYQTTRWYFPGFDITDCLLFVPVPGWGDTRWFKKTCTEQTTETPKTGEGEERIWTSRYSE